MNKHNKRFYEQHCKDLEALGAADGRKAYKKLCKIENTARSVALKACNDGVSEKVMNETYVSTMKAVKEVFGGKLPMGFIWNTDPRGKSLKINTEQNVIFVNSEDGRNHDERVIHYTDMGGYGILAPDFSGE